MPRLINLMDQKNLWGSTTDKGLEPQRTDLWLVDMTQIVKGLNSLGLFEKLGLASVPVFFKQFVQAVTIPDIKTKSEVVRRNSTPFSMPSWDEPLEAIKITFLVDTTPNENGSLVLSLLQAWKAAVRAGRGTVDGLFPHEVGYAPDLEPYVLNAQFRYSYTFPLHIQLLRGSSEQDVGFVPSMAQLNQQMVNQSAYQKDLDSRLQLNAGSATASLIQLGSPNSIAANILKQSPSPKPTLLTSALQTAASWTFNDVWLSGWKMGDLSYVDSKLHTVEATLYAESFEQTGKTV